MIADAVKQELQNAISGPVLFDEPMSRHTTMRVGGPADALVYPNNIEEMRVILQIAHANKLPLFIFGWGSNLLVRDGGIRGIVINFTQGLQRIEILSTEGDMVKLHAEAGVKMPALLDFVVKEGLTGLECMAGIPATVGGAIWMNAGTPDGEIGDRVETVTILNRKGQSKDLDRKACGFSYRSTQIPPGSIVIAATLCLQRGETNIIRDKINLHKEHRIATQPLNLPNLGSVFKNPSKRHAGQLIERAGLKNVRVGEARISEKHGNFIVNEGEASAKDVLALIGLVKDKVKEKYNVRLEAEVQVVGEEKSVGTI